ncbi:MAG TPA: HAMP domain-containing sensor histidine kinase [Armatimonadota bacterium]|nr:HAMP domain-containing sensor histidine kinase [Armatimonadota bacterium]
MITSCRLPICLSYPKDPPILGNPGQLQQVFTNLIMNAYQAMLGQEGGELTIKTSLQSDMVQVDVIDTGPGFPKKHLDHLFEPFFTTKPEGKGTGLGLSIAYGIIQSHGGSIKVHSIEGRGTSFSVSFPTKHNESEDQA